MTNTTHRPGRRITVIGSTGSGKTTMARMLAERLDLPRVELDALHWGPNWTEEPDDLFRERTDLALRGDAWVVDGNYTVVRDIVWPRADTVVWLDYGLPVIMWRLTRRLFRRAVLKEEIWHGNTESLRTHFMTKDSLYVWALQTYRPRRRKYPARTTCTSRSYTSAPLARPDAGWPRWASNRLGTPQVAGPIPLHCCHDNNHGR
jgi:adenylate kinase family enzyme